MAGCNLVFCMFQLWLIYYNIHHVVAEIEYTINEEMPPGSYVGNVKSDYNFSSFEPQLLHQWRFELNTQSPGNFFKIDSITGVIETTKPIDREEIYPDVDINLGIFVKPHSHFMFIKVVVHVLDKNDNQPAFEESSVEISISEASKRGTVFPLPSAKDKDGHAFGLRRYSLQSNTDKFRLNVTRHYDGTLDPNLVLRKKLDREKEDSYSLTLIAWDGGKPSQSGSVVINVIVTDANDNVPKFDKSLYGISIHENKQIGSSVTRVHATDPDAGVNGDLVYAFSPSTLSDFGDIFRIDNHTGDIYVKGDIDYEVTPKYELTVVAKDKSSRPLSAFTKVVVEVLDINDHAPEINANSWTQSGDLEVLENSAIGTVVAYISVSDPESGDSARFDCSVDKPQFELQALPKSNFNKYNLLTAAVFDREARAEYDVGVTCYDDGNPPMASITPLTVKILDENDNTPKFRKKSYRGSIQENNNVGDRIATVSATDKDNGDNGTVRYSIHGHDTTPDHVVTIDPDTGVIRAQQVFDHEKQQSYQFVVEAKDNGTPQKSSSVMLTLSVTDTNDAPPRFSEKSYKFEVTENSQPWTVVGQVKATDADSSAYNVILFSLDPTSNEDKAFTIDTKSGELLTTVRLDREKKSVYHLIVVAQNEGSPKILTTTNLTVYVLDENDNPPVFKIPNIRNNTTQITSDAIVGDLVYQVHAEDQDIGKHAEVKYKIIKGNEDKVFRINPITGAITVTKNLKSLANNIYRLVIQVSDEGSPPESSTVTLTVVVDASATWAGQQGAFVHTNYFLILIGVLCGIIVIVIVIVIAIVLTRRRDRRKRKRTEKYQAELEAEKSSSGSWDDTLTLEKHRGGSLEREEKDKVSALRLSSKIHVPKSGVNPTIQLPKHLYKGEMEKDPNSAVTSGKKPTERGRREQSRLTRGQRNRMAPSRQKVQYAPMERQHPNGDFEVDPLYNKLHSYYTDPDSDCGDSGRASDDGDFFTSPGNIGETTNGNSDSNRSSPSSQTSLIPSENSITPSDFTAGTATDLSPCPACVKSGLIICAHAHTSSSGPKPDNTDSRTPAREGSGCLSNSVFPRGEIGKKAAVSMGTDQKSQTLQLKKKGVRFADECGKELDNTMTVKQHELTDGSYVEPPTEVSSNRILATQFSDKTASPLNLIWSKDISASEALKLNTMV